MVAEQSESTDWIHPHARVIAKRCGLPESRLAYLDDPDQIEEYAEIIVRHRQQTHRIRLRAYWSLFYGGTGLLLVSGLLFSVVLIALAVIWLLIFAVLGLTVLKPAP